MNILDIIEEKRDGNCLSKEQIQYAIQQYSTGQIPDYQMSSLLMAIYIRGMNLDETTEMTRAMLDSGSQVVFEGLDLIPMDKHSTGGVGDKITLPLVPLVMTYGIPIPMLSGRSLGFSGGTLDKLESIPGFRVDYNLEEYKQRVRTTGAVIMGQTKELAPADKKIYALRDVTSTVPSIPLITSSILSKKVAGGAKGLVLDVKVGKGAFMQTLKDARALARSLLDVGSCLGLKISGYITNMNEPLGRMVGNALEVRETLDILNGQGPSDSTELTVMLGGEMLLLAGVVPSLEEGRMKIKEAIENGQGTANFKKLIESQEGNPKIVDQPDLLPTTSKTKEIVLPEKGWVKRIHAQKIALAAFVLGAGRMKVEDKIDPRVGIEMLKKVGQRVQEGEPVVRMHYSENSDLVEAEKRILEAFHIDDIPPQPEPLIWERIGSEE